MKLLKLSDERYLAVEAVWRASPVPTGLEGTCQFVRSEAYGRCGDRHIGPSETYDHEFVAADTEEQWCCRTPSGAIEWLTQEEFEVIERSL